MDFLFYVFLNLRFSLDRTISDEILMATISDDVLMEIIPGAILMETIPDDFAMGIISDAKLCGAARRRIARQEPAAPTNFKKALGANEMRFLFYVVGTKFCPQIKK